MQLPMSTIHPQLMLWHFLHLGNNKSQYYIMEGLWVSSLPIPLVLSLSDKHWALLTQTQHCLLARPLARHQEDSSLVSIFTWRSILVPSLKSELISLSLFL